MEPRISIITLGVDDLSRSFKFYTDGSPGDHLWEVAFNPHDSIAEE